MGFHKATKFPFEVTKGKSKELFQLRFMRKSELEPNLRHNFRLNVCQMGRQLDMWFKEQVYTIGTLNKEQEKFYQAHRRLRREIRQSKKREYARRQEEIREKLVSIKTNMMAMKVIHKWRSNLRQSKLEKELELEEIRKSIANSNMNASGNESQDSGNSIAKPHDSDENLPADSDGDKNNSNPHKMDETKIEDAPFGDTNEESAFFDGYDQADNLDIEHAIHSDSDDIDSGPDLDNYLPDDVDSLNGSRYPSSQGPRMETIPEERNDTELEINDSRGLPRLTKRRLHLLNRSHSRRNVFDGYDPVPLLPDLGLHNTTQQSHHAPTDTADKETQTSEKLDPPATNEQGARTKNKNSSKTSLKKKIVVKMPKTPTSKTRDKRSWKHKQSIVESDGSESEDERFEEFINSNNQQYDSDEYDDNDADDELSPNHTLHRRHPGALMKHKTTVHRKSDFSDRVPSVPLLNNLEPNFPPASPVGNHSPFPMHYKNRGYPIKPEYYEHSYGNYSARSNEFDTQNRSQRTGWRSTDEMRQRLESSESITRPHMCVQPKMAIFGKKANSLAESMTPPNSPSPSISQADTRGAWRNNRSHTNHGLYTQKRAKAAEQKRVHDIVVNEPVQQYERTRSGKIKPLGTPRSPTQEIKLSSLKDQYHRHKLLKTERDIVIKQTIKMKRFMNVMDTFKQERNSTVLPPIPTDTVDESDTDGANTENKPKRTIGNLFFKVQQSEQDTLQKQKVVPGAKTTSLRLLKECRYLRDYKPMSVEEKTALYPDKESSWNMQHTSQQHIEHVHN